VVSCSAYSSTLKMEAICSFETSVEFQRTTRRYIPEDSTLHNHRCETLKSYTVNLKLDHDQLFYVLPDSLFLAMQWLDAVLPEIPTVLLSKPQANKNNLSQTHKLTGNSINELQLPNEGSSTSINPHCAYSMAPNKIKRYHRILLVL
jgi:hypothetical protein